MTQFWVQGFAARFTMSLYLELGTLNFELYPGERNATTAPMHTKL